MSKWLINVFHFPLALQNVLGASVHLKDQSLLVSIPRLNRA